MCLLAWVHHPLKGEGKGGGGFKWICNPARCFLMHPYRCDFGLGSTTSLGASSRTAVGIRIRLGLDVKVDVWMGSEVTVKVEGLTGTLFCCYLYCESCIYCPPDLSNPASTEFSQFYGMALHVPSHFLLTILIHQHLFLFSFPHVLLDLAIL